MKISKPLAILISLTMVFAITSCAKKLKSCIGNISYSSSAICMCYEDVPGEYDESGEAMQGIVYREVKDLDGIMSQKEMPVLMYFYTTDNPTAAGITAGVEDLAERFNGKIVVVAVDASAYPTLNTELNVTAVPEFVLFSGGAKVANFGSDSKSNWTVNDIVSWLATNGIS
ncbi:MAG: hypothetical protein K5745_03795 [Saccharofermentans sp.]|nr:hypothetical protein [Saccharofermentans sp.]